MRKNITVEFTNERIIPSGGLAVVGAILGKSDFVKNCNNTKVDCNHPRHQIKNGDVMLTYIGMQCMGKPSFDAVHEMDDDPDFYIGGYGNGMFGPNDNITREQLAVMLWRYAGSPAATDKELHFTDADQASGFALEALRWAVENGIINGYGDGQLAPQGLATRGQVAQMLMNFLKNR